MRYTALTLLLAVALVPLLVIKQPAQSLEGQAEDDAGPVANAHVRFKGTPFSAVTGADGTFRLPRRPFPTITAWKEGYLIAGEKTGRSPLTLRLQRLPTQDFEDYAWVEPGPWPAGEHNCVNCHRDIYQEWSASGHARAVDNRRFRNLYEGTDWHGRKAGWSLLDQNPDAGGVCTACHAPTVAFGDPAYYDLRAVRGVAARGVHCDYCHKVVDASTDKLGATHGRFGLKLLRPAEGQLFFGPLDDVDRGEDSFFPVYRESRYCASCHEGTVLGVHVYSTYTEWLASPARREGKQCQTCHMAPTGTMTNIAPNKGGIARDPSTLASHRFPGSQAEMLRHCLKVDVALTPRGDDLRATVTVRADDVGHRVPSGFIDRQLLLVVEALDEQGQRLTARPGPVIPAVVGKELAGRSGRLYAKVITDESGLHPAPFWKAASEVQDTRLSPGQPDQAEFVFPAQAARLRVRLLYRRFWQEVAEQKGWPADEVVVVDRIVEARTR